MAAETYPLPKPAKQIGGPYQGTHAKAFNKAGGSDNWESENAVDLATPKGTPIYAVANGTIGKQIGAQGGGRFAGLRVHLVSSSNEYYYAHLSKLVVKAGETVTAGQLIGYSGVANGVAHLHFAAKTGDPTAIFSQAGDASTITDATATGGQGQAPASVLPPSSVPPPTALGLPGSGPEMPGSESYQINPSHVVSLWQQAATGDMVSPETAQLLSNAQISVGSGGANAGGQG